MIVSQYLVHILIIIAAVGFYIVVKNLRKK